MKTYTMYAHLHGTSDTDNVCVLAISVTRTNAPKSAADLIGGKGYLSEYAVDDAFQVLPGSFERELIIRWIDKDGSESTKRKSTLTVSGNGELSAGKDIYLKDSIPDTRGYSFAISHFYP